MIGYCNNVEQEKSKNVEQEKSKNVEQEKSKNVEEENGLWHMGYLNYGASQGQGLGNGPRCGGFVNGRLQ